MARPKKVDQLNTAGNDSNKLIQDLFTRIDELEKKLKAKESEESKEPINDIVELDESDDIDLDIRADKYIKVMSLNSGKLNLSTEPFGKGKVFVFPKFGSMRQIMYSELVNVIHNHQRFIEEGRFYILDKNVIRKHGLLEIYSTILNKENIEKVLTCNSRESLALYKSANEKQQDIIDQLLICKVRDGADVDLNIVSAISKIAGVDLLAKAEEAKEFKKLMETPLEVSNNQ